MNNNNKLTYVLYLTLLIYICFITIFFVFYGNIFYIIYASVLYILVLFIFLFLIIRSLNQLSKFSEYINHLEIKELHNQSKNNLQKFNDTITNNIFTNNVYRSLAKIKRKIQLAQILLKEEKEKYKSVLDSIPIPILIVNDKKLIIKANVEAEYIFRKSFDDSYITEHFRQPEILTALNKSFIGEESQVDIEDQNSDNLKVSHYRVYLHPTFSDLVDSNFISMVFVDQSHLKHIINVRTTFIANASHSIRTPLTTMLGVIDAIKGPAKNDPKTQKKFLIILFTQVNKLHTLTTNLLNLSQIEMSEQNRPDSIINLSQILKDLISDSTNRIIESNKNINHEIQKDIYIQGNSNEIYQLCNNILDNSIKYGGAKIEISMKKIKLSTNQQNNKNISNNYVCIIFSDNGKGVPAENLYRITERFYRMKTNNNIDGSGLGLAIAKHIVNRHSGILTITNTDKMKVRIDIPFKQA